MTDVIVIAKHFPISVGVIRSLGEAGYGVRFLALSDKANLIVSKSKYVRQTYQADRSFESILKALETLRGQEDRMLILPLDEFSCIVLDEHAEQLKEHYMFPSLNDDPGAIAELMKKTVQKSIARECGLRTAEGQSYTTDEEGIRRAICEVSYPCFQKPIASESCKTGAKTCFAKCSNPEELQKAMRAARAAQCDTVLLEAFLPIEKELTAYGVAANGRVYIPACMEMIRGGFGHLTGVAAEGVVKSAQCLGEIQTMLEEFIRKIGFTGLFCLDLIQSNGTVYFSEMNLRAGGNQYAITLTGANLPGVLADAVYRGSTDGPKDILREVHFLNDFIEFTAYYQGFITRKEYKAHISGRQELLFNRKEDPGPWKQYNKSIAQKIKVKLFIKRMLHMKKPSKETM